MGKNLWWETKTSGEMYVFRYIKDVWIPFLLKTEFVGKTIINSVDVYTTQMDMMNQLVKASIYHKLNKV